MIKARQKGDGDPMEFDVAVSDSRGEANYDVTMRRADYERLTGGSSSPTRAMEAAFAFLLDREPKEAILRSFDLGIISTYFPEFEQSFGGYLAEAGKGED